MNFYSDDILQLIVAVAAGYAMFKAGAAYTIWKIQQDLIALENGEIEFVEEGQEAPENKEFMNIEKQGDTYYAYGEQRGFLTQGASLKELLTNVKDNYPGTTWLIGYEHETLSKEEQDAVIPTLKSIFEETKE